MNYLPEKLLLSASALNLDFLQSRDKKFKEMKAKSKGKLRRISASREGQVNQVLMEQGVVDRE